MQEEIFAATIRCFGLLCLTVLVAGCVQDASTYLRPVPVATAPPTKTSTQADTINLEASDRIARFRRLADSAGVTPPQVDQVYAPAGTVPGVSAPVPVVRVVFPEKVFFDFNQPSPRQDSLAVIDLVAENMKHDVPDAALTILGHTDAIGSDEYNVELSKRRAASVLGFLIERGLNPNQLSTVAIGKAQPIASNATEEGRARNRRVEFLISGSEAANISVVRERTVDQENFRTTAIQATPISAPATVQVLKPRPTAEPEDPDNLLGPAGMITLRTPEAAPQKAEPAALPAEQIPAPTPVVAPRQLAPDQPIVPRTPETIVPAPLHAPNPANF